MLKNLLLNNEFARFLVVGVINTAVGFGVYALLNLFVHYQLAYSVAFACGIVLSYWLNARWVFKEALRWKAFFAFPLVYVVQFSLGVLVLGFLVEFVYLAEWLAFLVVTAVTFPVTFVLSRFIVKKKTRTNPG